MNLARENGLSIADVDSIALHFARSGAHCIDANPLKSHCAQYFLPVALTKDEWMQLHAAILKVYSGPATEE